MTQWTIGSGILRIVQGDLTAFEAEAIVNAANSRLAGGGGVDGAIHRAAGPELLMACQEIITDIGVLPAGQAVITPGFRLPARHVIHTVGPIYRDGRQGEEALLGSAYAESLALAARSGVRTIAFPAVSCGVYGYPADKAARVALGVLKQGLEDGLTDEASMVLHGDESCSVWTRIGLEILGPPEA